MLLSEITQNIKNLLEGGISSDDFDLSKAQIAFWVNYYRARLIKQEQEKGRFENSLYIQNLGRVPLVKADKNECCEIEDCILRTRDKIPSPLETYKGLNLTYVGLNNGMPFQHSTHNAIVWSCAAKYTGKLSKWYYQNGYIYIVNPPTALLSEINIQGIFEDPRDAEEFRTCDCNNDTDCNDEDLNYPLPAYQIDVIVKLIAQTELTVLTSMPSDTTNDSIDRLAQNGNT
jgi:hypothetical protein